MTTAMPAREHAPTRAGSSRARRVAPALVVGVGAALAAVLVGAFDPERGGGVPLCPFHAVTGLDCPGCGMTRGVHDLMRGDLVAAVDHNVLLVPALLAAVLAWWGWTRRAWTGRSRRFELPRPAVMAILVVLLVFWVVRNLPGVPFLDAA